MSVTWLLVVRVCSAVNEVLTQEVGRLSCYAVDTSYIYKYKYGKGCDT